MRLTDSARVLEAIADGQWHTHHELYALHVIVHSRVSDLRKLGYQVERSQETRGGAQVFLYRLAAVPPQPTRLEEQLDRAGAWAAVAMLRRRRQEGFSQGGGAPNPPAPTPASPVREGAASHVAGGPAGSDEELVLLEGEIRSLEDDPRGDAGVRLVALRCRRDELERMLCATEGSGCPDGAPTGEARPCGAGPLPTIGRAA